MSSLPQSPSYIYRATVYAVIDGDTVDARVDVGFSVWAHVRFRLYGINAPELKGETFAAGDAAKNHLENRIRKFAIGSDQSRPVILMRSHKGRTQDKYGRWLAELIGIDSGTGDQVLINDLMVKDGHAIPYMVDKQ